MKGTIIQTTTTGFVELRLFCACPRVLGVVGCAQEDGNAGYWRCSPRYHRGNGWGERPVCGTAASAGTANHEGRNRATGYLRRKAEATS